MQRPTRPLPMMTMVMPNADEAIDIEAEADEADVANMADEADKAIGANKANKAIVADEANVLEHTSQ